MRSRFSQTINGIGKRGCVGGPLLLLSALIAGCNFPGEPNPQEGQAVAADADSFANLYATNCSGCHGPDGQMGPAPPLNDPLFLSIVPSDVVESVIRDGRPGTLMPAFAQKKGGTLDSRQVSILTSELRSHWLPGGPKEDHLPPYLTDRKRERANGTLQQGRPLSLGHVPVAMALRARETARARSPIRRSWRCSAIKLSAASLSPGAPISECQPTPRKKGGMTTTVR